MFDVLATALASLAGCRLETLGEVLSGGAISLSKYVPSENLIFSKSRSRL